MIRTNVFSSVVALLLLAIGCGSTTTSATPGTDAGVEAGDSALAADGSSDDAGLACGAAPYVREAVRVADLDDTGAEKLLAGARLSFSTCSGTFRTTDSKGEGTAVVSRGTPFYLRVDADGHVPVIFGETLFSSDFGTAIDGHTALLPRTPSPAALPAYGLDRPSLAVVLIAAGTGRCAEPAGAIFEVVDHPEAKAVTMNLDWPKNPTPAPATGAGTVTFFTGLAGGQYVSVKGSIPSCRLQLDTRGQTGRFYLENGAFTIGNAVISDPG